MDALAGMSDDSEEDIEEGHTRDASAADSQANKSTGEQQFHSCCEIPLSVILSVAYSSLGWRRLCGLNQTKSD